MNICIDIKHNKTPKFEFMIINLVLFLHFSKYSSLRPLVSCTYHTSYFIYTSIELAFFAKTLEFCITWDSSTCCTKLNALQLMGTLPHDPLLLSYNSGVNPSPQKILDLPLGGANLRIVSLKLYLFLINLFYNNACEQADLLITSLL